MNKPFFIFLVLIAIVTYTNRSDWNNGFNNKPFQFVHDVDQYYSYLVAYEIKEDLSFTFPTDRGYWVTPQENGNNIPKMTMGMAIMMAPFFYIGHNIALNNEEEYTADGYSLPYAVSIRIGTCIYVLFGLFFLFKSLSFFYNKWVSALATFLVFIGTNLFLYTMRDGEMTHSYLFTLFSLFTYSFLQFYHHKKPIFAIILLAVLGLSVLIRPTSIIILLFPLFYGGIKKEILVEKLYLLKRYKLYLFIGILFFCFPIFLQLLYWKIYAGSWVTYSYTDEGFFFNNPRIIDFLFGYRKGLFIYTPIVLLSIVGLIMAVAKRKTFGLSIVLIFGVSVFVLSSWWCWWFGGSFGSRSMIEYYSFLAFPLATVFAFFLKRISTGILAGVIAVLAVWFNLFLIKKYPNSIHWDAMCEESFWISMQSTHLDPETDAKYQNSLCHPNYENAKKGLHE